MINRREFAGNFLKVIAGSIVATQPLLQLVQAQTGLPISDLRRSLSPVDGLIVVPGDRGFARYQAAYNIRTTLVPELRVLCKSAKGISTVVQWAISNNVGFSSRGAGHCYEDFSQNLHLVIDTRLMTDFHRDSDLIFSVGSGSNLGAIYKSLSLNDQAFPAGSCPTVGIAGHSLGGGYGLLARPMGLACDSLTSIEIITADGKITTASQSENADLLWALRGGGGGSFGVVSKFTIQAQRLKNVSTYSATWVLSVSEAVKVFRAWQAWAPHAPKEITSTLSVRKDHSGKIRLHSSGQSVGSESSLRSQVLAWTKGSTPSSPIKLSTLSFIGAVNHFAGGGWVYQPVLMKGRSDYVKSPITDEGIRTLMSEMLKFGPGSISAICDSYGGKIAEPAVDSSAFAHRDALFSIQYYSQWVSAKDTPSKLAMSRQVYQAMRPYVSGFAYVNYPDAELPDYARAYWGDNLAMLKQIKSKYDPGNVFKHRQSVPLASSFR